jgi:hypothetical protein
LARAASPQPTAISPRNEIRPSPRKSRETAYDLDHAVADIEQHDDPERPLVGGRDVRKVRKAVVVVLVHAADAVKPIAEAFDHLLHDRQPPCRIVNLDRQDLGSGRHLRLLYPRNIAGRAFDLGRAGSAVHPGHSVSDLC